METAYDTIVIGGGQSGLSTGFFLKQRGEDFLVMDSSHRAGDSWRNRWDSLTLFTPAQYDGLPGMPFPKPKGTYPTKDEMADYLEVYFQNFRLPVRYGISVSGIEKKNGGFEISTNEGVMRCHKVVVATGTHPVPKIPAFAGELDRNILQVHSSTYHNEGSVSPGDVLVVGAGTSGTEIAIELSSSHRTYLAGHPTFHIPDEVFRYAGGLYWWFVNHVITIKTPLGRKAKEKMSHSGGPLIRISVEDLDRAAVVRVPRLAGVEDGRPLLEDGTILQVNTVVWATGYRPDFSWIHPSVTGESGWPQVERGVHTGIEGLYFVGLPFQFGLTSGLIGGVGRDAEYVTGMMARA